MGVLNDDGVALDLNIVLILFLTPNILLILLTALCTYCAYASKKCPRLLNFIGTSANFFSRGAFVTIIASILQQLEAEKTSRSGTINIGNFTFTSSNQTKKLSTQKWLFQITVIKAYFRKKTGRRLSFAHSDANRLASNRILLQDSHA